MINTLNLKNYQMEVLVSALNYKMPLVDGRIRRHFFDIINPQVTFIEESRKELCLKYSKKDEKNQPVVKDGSFVMEESTLQEFNEEFRKFMAEEYIVDVMPSKVEEFKTIERLLLNSPVEMEIPATNVYMEICREFEMTLTLEEASAQNGKRGE